MVNVMMVSLTVTVIDVALELDFSLIRIYKIMFKLLSFRSITLLIESILMIHTNS